MQRLLGLTGGCTTCRETHVLHPQVEVLHRELCLVPLCFPAIELSCDSNLLRGLCSSLLPESPSSSLCFHHCRRGAEGAVALLALACVSGRGCKEDSMTVFYHKSRRLEEARCQQSVRTLLLLVMNDVADSIEPCVGRSGVVVVGMHVYWPQDRWKNAACNNRVLNLSMRKSCCSVTLTNLLFFSCFVFVRQTQFRWKSGRCIPLYLKMQNKKLKVYLLKR